MKKQSKKSAGRSADAGNVTIDLGEEIDKKLRTAIGSRSNKLSVRRSGYRPGMFGGYRPFHASSGRSMLGAKGLGLPERLETGAFLTGGVIGLIANRALIRLTPGLIGTSAFWNEVTVAALGILPLFVKRNSTTMGVALPGVVFVASQIVNAGLNAIGVQQVAGMSGNQNAALSARQKLADIQARLQHQAQSRVGVLPRVVAQPLHA